MKQLICYTKFKLDPFSDGGSKRSVQIRELLQERGISFIDDFFTLPKNASICKLAKWAFRATSFIHRHYPVRIKSISKYLRLIKYYALRIPAVLDRYADRDVDFLWENTNDRDIVFLLKATGHRVIGLPHNIESLVHGKSAKKLEEEVNCLRHCDAVFAISKEETWLLRLLGLNAHYLPYYPPKEVDSFLISIRGKRELRRSNSRKIYSLLGSATNIPTRSGMQALINFAATKELPFDLLVAGYGTESLKNVSHSSISFLGTLSTEELENMLVEVDGVIIYQPPTTGSLTRIPEMLLAGVPVFANFDAARNYFGISGITLYSSFNDLIDRLNAHVPFCFNSPIREESAETEFLNYLANDASTFHYNY